MRREEGNFQDEWNFKVYVQRDKGQTKYASHISYEGYKIIKTRMLRISNCCNG